MKKIYLTPQTTIDMIEPEQQLLEGSIKIYNKEIEADAMTKEDKGWSDIWE